MVNCNAGGLDPRLRPPGAAPAMLASGNR